MIDVNMIRVLNKANIFIILFILSVKTSGFLSPGFIFFNEFLNQPKFLSQASYSLEIYIFNCIIWKYAKECIYIKTVNNIGKNINIAIIVPPY